MAIDRENGTTTQLLTLLNVSATKLGKRKWILDDIQPTQRLNRRRTVKFSAAVDDSEHQGGDTRHEEKEDAAMDKTDEVEEDKSEDLDVDEDITQSVWHCRSYVSLTDSFVTNASRHHC